MKIENRQKITVAVPSESVKSRASGNSSGSCSERWALRYPNTIPHSRLSANGTQG